MTDTQTPERIWVAYAEGSESRDELPEVFAALEEWELAKLTKCYESPALPFVRADLHAAVVAERDQLKRLLKEAIEWNWIDFENEPEKKIFPILSNLASEIQTALEKRDG